MACGGCARRRQMRSKKDFMAGYKTLPPNQIKARLERFKKAYCRDCDKRYDCNYNMYLSCDRKDN